MTHASGIHASNDTQSRFQFDAFISYSHAADGRLAPALQRGLQRFAKPWYRLRAMRIFRDQTGLAVTPELWTAIETALAGSRYFLLLASPIAAESKWVAQEVHWWLTHRRAEQLLIILTDGELTWDSSAGDFDWTRTNALPRLLEKSFPLEPLHLDLRWAKTASHLSLRRPDFADAIARLAATLRGLSLDDLAGEEVRQHQSAMRWARGVGLGLLAAAAAGILVSLVSLQAKRLVTPLAREKEAQAALRSKEELSGRLATQALDLADTDRDLAILLAAEAVRIQPSTAAESTLRQTLSAELAPTVTLYHETNESCHVAIHPDGIRVLTWGPKKALRLRDASSGRVLVEFPDLTHDVAEARFNRDGGRFCSLGNDGTLHLCETSTGRVLVKLPTDRTATALLSPDGTRCLQLQEGAGGALWDIPAAHKISDIDFFSNQVFLVDRVQQASFSPDGERLAVTTRGGVASVIEAKTGRVLHELSDHAKPVTSVAFSPDHRWLVTASLDGTLRRWNAATGHCEEVMDHGAALAHAVFSPDGRWIAALQGTRALIVWETGSRNPSRRIDLLPAPEAPVIFNFSPNGKCLLTASYDADSAQVWETASGKRLAVLTAAELGGPIRSVGFSADGKRVAIGALSGPARIHPTEICGTAEDLLTLASRRVSRELTTAERHHYRVAVRHQVE